MASSLGLAKLFEFREAISALLRLWLRKRRSSCDGRRGLRAPDIWERFRQIHSPLLWQQEPKVMQHFQHRSAVGVRLVATLLLTFLASGSAFAQGAPQLFRSYWGGEASEFSEEPILACGLGVVRDSRNSASLATDREGHIYMATPSNSTQPPVLAGSVIGGTLGGCFANDSYLAKLSSDGTQTLMTVAVAGAVTAIQVTDDGSIWCVSALWPTSATVQGTGAGNIGLLTVLNPDGTTASTTEIFDCVPLDLSVVPGGSGEAATVYVVGFTQGSFSPIGVPPTLVNQLTTTEAMAFVARVQVSTDPNGVQSGTVDYGARLTQVTSLGAADGGYAFATSVDTLPNGRVAIGGTGALILNQPQAGIQIVPNLLPAWSVSDFDGFIMVLDFNKPANLPPSFLYSAFLTDPNLEMAQEVTDLEFDQGSGDLYVVGNKEGPDFPAVASPAFPSPFDPTSNGNTPGDSRISGFLIGLELLPPSGAANYRPSYISYIESLGFLFVGGATEVFSIDVVTSPEGSSERHPIIHVGGFTFLPENSCFPDDTSLNTSFDLPMSVVQGRHLFTGKFELEVSDSTTVDPLFEWSLANEGVQDFPGGRAVAVVGDNFGETIATFGSQVLQSMPATQATTIDYCNPSTVAAADEIAAGESERVIMKFDNKPFSNGGNGMAGTAVPGFSVGAAPFLYAEGRLSSDIVIRICEGSGGPAFMFATPLLANEQAGCAPFQGGTLVGLLPSGALSPIVPIALSAPCGALAPALPGTQVLIPSLESLVLQAWIADPQAQATYAGTNVLEIRR